MKKKGGKQTNKKAEQKHRGNIGNQIHFRLMIKCGTKSLWEKVLTSFLKLPPCVTLSG